MNIWILTWFDVDHFTLRVIGSKKNHQQKYFDSVPWHTVWWQHNWWRLMLRPQFSSSLVNLSHSPSPQLASIPPPYFSPLSHPPVPRRERQMAHSGKVRWGGDKGSSRKIGNQVRKGGHKCWVGVGLMGEKRREKVNEGKGHDQMIRGR